ncbi:MFS transporter [Vibrio coralliilyticus]|uniref:MFS transporter n=1 Tax=Vibrio coralliilyticus TaxID=190893 RepID=UPI00155F6A8A|nr:MFS transporter [Vibrio coralliilyticus]NRF64346.1 MFS transporter [Vibrio coralliilyticus]
MTVALKPSTLWQNVNYVRLLSAQVISLIGTGVSSVCLALLAYDLAEENAGAVLSIAFALKMLAYIGLAPVFGVLAHKLPKRQTLVALDIIRALMFACLPFVTEVWEVYVLMFVINACSAGFTPMFQSTLPQVLPDKDDYARALSYSRLAYDLEQIFSPMLTALLLSVISFRQLFMLDSMTFLLSGVLIILCTLPKRKELNVQPKKLSFRSVLSGISAYLEQPSLRALWYAYLAAASASAMVLVNTVVYVHDILHGSETQTAMAMLVVGLGSMLVAIFLPRLLKHHQPQRYHLRGLVFISVAFLAGTWTPGWIGFGLMCFALGIGMSCIQTTSGLIINAAAEGKESGEYFAAHFSLTHFWWLVTYLSSGLSAKWLGLAGAYWVMLGLCLVSVALYLAQTRKNAWGQ